MPNVVLEAMACGMPVVVTASGGAEYIIDGTMGIVCPPEDPNALVVAMSRLLAMPSERLALMGNRAQQFVLSQHDLRRVARQYLDLFKKTIRQANPR
jgi:glycosyltransferase involved in cell wall biosynthesis